CLALGERRSYSACTLSITGVAFGAYDVFNTTPLDSTGAVVFECDKQDKRIRIILSTGSSGSFAARTMTQGADVLWYNLYINGLATIWGDGTAGTGYYFTNNPPNNRPVTVTIYGRVPAGQDVRRGPYADMIQVQIDF
ncbi:MAG: SCPU domain-containing protein, partial [Acidobacteria bacterium]